MTSEFAFRLVLASTFIFIIHIARADDYDDMPGNDTINYDDDYFIIANDDIVRMHENRSRAIEVLPNDHGIDDGIGSISIVVPPKHGYAKINPSKTITYTPDYLFVGSDQFTYKLCNTHGLCDEATVFITVLDFDYKPVAVNDTLRVTGHTTVDISPLNNDLDLDDPPLTLTILSDLRIGNSMFAGPNRLTIQVTSYFTGKDSLVYKICDKDGDCAIANIYLVMTYEDDDGYFIPQGFSPNGDGINDTYNIPGFDIFSNLSIVIFDRHGEVVFNDGDYDNNWTGVANTGRFNGSLLPAGIYYYLMRVNETGKEVKGFIFLGR